MKGDWMDEARQYEREDCEAQRQAEGEKCERCGDEGTVYEVIASTPNGDEYGEEPCPDCKPEDGEGR